MHVCEHETSNLFFPLPAVGPEPPMTMTKEWEDAWYEKLLEDHSNPITGYSSKHKPWRKESS